MKMKRTVRGVLLAVAVVLAIGSVPAAGGASTAKPNEHRAILRAIL